MKVSGLGRARFRQFKYLLWIPISMNKSMLNHMNFEITWKKIEQVDTCEHMPVISYKCLEQPGLTNLFVLFIDNTSLIKDRYPPES